MKKIILIVATILTSVNMMGQIKELRSINIYFHYNKWETVKDFK